MMKRFLPKTLDRGLRMSGALILAGLAIEFVTLFWTHALSFLLFANVGAVLIGAGIVLYLISLVLFVHRPPSADEPSSDA